MIRSDDPLRTARLRRPRDHRPPGAAQRAERRALRRAARRTCVRTPTCARSSSPVPAPRSAPAPISSPGSPATVDGANVDTFRPAFETVLDAIVAYPGAGDRGDQRARDRRGHAARRRVRPPRRRAGRADGDPRRPARHPPQRAQHLAARDARRPGRGARLPARGPHRRRRRSAAARPRATASSGDALGDALAPGRRHRASAPLHRAGAQARAEPRRRAAVAQQAAA